MFEYVNFRLCANPGRGNYFISSYIDSILLKSRKSIKHFINANNYECVFYKSVTEASNAICIGLYNKYHKLLKIVACVDNHHSIIGPWLSNNNFNVNIIGLDVDFIPNVRQYLKLVNKNILAVVLTHMSNVLGILVPLRLYLNISNSSSCVSIIDGTQVVPH